MATIFRHHNYPLYYLIVYIILYLLISKYVHISPYKKSIFFIILINNLIIFVIPLCRGHPKETKKLLKNRHPPANEERPINKWQPKDISNKDSWHTAKGKDVLNIKRNTWRQFSFEEQVFLQVNF